MKPSDIIDRLAASEAALRDRGVEHLAIFGSRARGDARPDSDLDVLLDVRDTSSFSLIDLVGIEQFIADQTGLKTFAALRRSLDRDFAETIADDVTEIF